jgi:DNA-directed RNA polymerase subunit alpha
MTPISIKCLKSKKIQSDTYHGQFVINSLKPGQGLTIGNQLRRVLLNDLSGIAISEVRITGVTHEFSTIPGVREDILEILLNLKGIIFKSDSTMKTVQFGRLKVQGPSVVTADLIQLPETLKIINPNHYIATISKLNILEIEFKFESGTGYKLANQTFFPETDGYLKLDAVFMPVQKVDFKIENLYESSNQISERLLLDIWTNGSISPNEALESASQIIIALFTSLINNKGINETDNIDLDSNSKSMNIEPYTNIAIEELQLSVRAYNCLKKAQINTIGDLLQYSPEKLQELKNFGRKSADEVFVTLKSKLGISLES